MDLPSSPTGYVEPGFGIAAAEHLLDLPGFWPVYYGPVWDEIAEEPEAFGADAADVDEAVEQLYGTTSTVWPAYRLPMAGGHLLWIVHRNYPEDSGTDYLVTHPDWEHHVYLASIEGHYSGPGLSWPELLAVAESAPADAEGVLDADLRLLLLLPAFGDADVPVAEAAERISRALTAVGVAAEVAPGLAEQFAEHPFWEEPTWTIQGRSPLSGGTAEPGPLAVCDERHSPRTAALGQGITRDQAHALADALAGRPATAQPAAR
jgi:hypothetical protein